MRTRENGGHRPAVFPERYMMKNDYAFFDAIRANDLETVKSMLAADPALINTPAPKKPADTRGMSPLRAALCTGWDRDIAWFLLELGADVRATDQYGRGVLMEAVEETSRLCPVRNEETGGFYPGRPVTEEMRHDIRRIFRLLIDAGADRENRSSYSGRTIRQHYEGSPVWELCGDMFQ